MPAFHKRKKNALTIARLVAGYGEVEFLLAWTAGAALACQTPVSSGVSKGEHRHNFEKEGLIRIFSIRKNSARIDEAKKISRPALTEHKLIDLYCDTLVLVWRALEIRNLFAHSHWDQRTQRGLFFVNLEESAKHGHPIKLITRHASTKSLATAESYFISAIEQLNYIAQSLAVRGGVAIGPEFTKPKKINGGVKTIDALFPVAPSLIEP
jgi:hypothetical protein